MNVLPEDSPTAELAPPTPAVEPWLLSFFLPGLGQFAQRRFFMGAGQLATVVAYGTTSLVLGSDRALLLAVAWNLWSAIDAYRHDRP